MSIARNSPIPLTAPCRNSIHRVHEEKMITSTMTAFSDHINMGCNPRRCGMRALHLIQRDPGTPTAWPSLATLVRDLGGILLVLALCACTRTPEQMIAEAKRLRDQGDTAAATIHVKNVLQRNPSDGEARFLLGTLYNALMDGPGAEAELRRTEALGLVKGGHVKAQLGRALLLQRDYKKLLSDVNVAPAFEEAAMAEILAYRGFAQLGLGQADEAARTFEQATRLVPDSPDALLGQATLKNRGGDPA